MNKKIEEITIIERHSKFEIYNSLVDYVLECGDDVSEFHLDEYGIMYGANANEKILKVLDIRSHGGCRFSVPLYYDGFGSNGQYVDFNCLYVVLEKDGNCYLKCSYLTNVGQKYDYDTCITMHDYVYSLRYACIEQLIRYIIDYDKQRENICLK